jgi:hypothetical protein
LKQTILTLAIALALAGNLGAHSGTPDHPTLDKAIRKSVYYPAFAKKSKLQGTVMVKYEVTNDGKVKVIDMNASHSELASYVQQQLEKLSINDLKSVGLHYARFTFKYVDRES